jgi:hypothetical protein
MFDEERFYDIYSDFENHFYTHSDRYNVTSPLENFQSGSDIDLGDGLRIRKITDEEIAQYLRQMESSMGIVTRFGMFPKGFGALSLGSVKHVLETTYLHQKGTAIDGSHCGESFEDIVTALRLFKSGSVDCNILLFVSTSWHPYFGSMCSGKGRYTSPTGAKYSLLDSEVTSFRRIWETYHNFRTKSVGSDLKKYLDIALKRFNLGIEEPDFEGKMIDYMISFEALLLPEASELKYRLSNRVATLLTEESRRAAEIRRTLAKAYDLRSVIVHGGEFQPIKIEGITIESRDFCSTIENYLRMCIRLFIVLSETYKRQQAIIDLIDEALFNDELKRELAGARKREMVFLV